MRDELIPTTSAYIGLLDAIIDNDVEVIWAAPGITFNLGEMSTLEILAPLRDYEKFNDYSVVARFVHRETSFLFTGDIESEAEHDLADNVYIRADVLHVAHHGSRSSSTARFLNAVGGSYAVISVGSPNAYNHPRQEVLNRLTARGYEVLRTDLHGNIIFDVTGEGLKVHVQHNN
jgi:beta-lactamase superfamily II metal-dependent hydrolase